MIPFSIISGLIYKSDTKLTGTDLLKLLIENKLDLKGDAETPCFICSSKKEIFSTI